MRECRAGPGQNNRRYGRVAPARVWHAFDLGRVDLGHGIALADPRADGVQCDLEDPFGDAGGRAHDLDLGGGLDRAYPVDQAGTGLKRPAKAGR